MFGRSWRKTRRHTAQFDGRSEASSRQSQSLREALRNRGGAQNVEEIQQTRLETASCASLGGVTSDDDKAGLQWLDLNAFAPRAWVKALDKLQEPLGPPLELDPQQQQRRASGTLSVLGWGVPPQLSGGASASKPSGADLKAILQGLLAPPLESVPEAADTLENPSPTPAQTPMASTSSQQAVPAAAAAVEAAASASSEATVEPAAASSVSNSSRPMPLRRKSAGAVWEERVSQQAAALAPVHQNRPALQGPTSYRDLSEFWGQQAVGFAGPSLSLQGKGQLSASEAQATLMRLASAGRAVDFDEVRRLRKLVALGNEEKLRG
eukprot:NODE_9038_length_1451_cov_3.726586.p1 GENE.NODE_9038_length_1451_cov_3.726586~~NODE_9038_length_1451_cov_3.726586.p1  ORF type:complete len:323 (-),score=93.16 NODE_9038_length_1451_cov_3.726586:392-1360(-)